MKTRTVQTVDGRTITLYYPETPEEEAALRADPNVGVTPGSFAEQAEALARQQSTARRSRRRTGRRH